jgi:tetratricopeptide (TPR) repeat protein
MPTSSTRDRSVRPWAASEQDRAVSIDPRGWIIASLLVVAVSPTAGCRALRGQRISDESIAAARQLSLQGMDAQQRGQWDQAETLFASAVSKCPRDERARCGYAEALWQRGAWGEAITHMEEAVRLSGHDPERLVQLGRMYRCRGELGRASEAAERAIAANPQLAGAWALRGEVLRGQGNDTDALASFHRALSYEGHFSQVQLAIAEIYRRTNRPQRAHATLQALTVSYPPGQAPVEVLVSESSALRALGRYADAARVLAGATQRDNPSADLLYELACTQVSAGEHTAARLTVAAALEREPRHAGCLALVQELGSRQGTVAAALPTRATAQ